MGDTEPTSEQSWIRYASSFADGDLLRCCRCAVLDFKLHDYRLGSRSVERDSFHFDLEHNGANHRTARRWHHHFILWRAPNVEVLKDNCAHGMVQLHCVHSCAPRTTGPIVLHSHMAHDILWRLHRARPHWLHAQLGTAQDAKFRQLNRPVLLQCPRLHACTVHLWRHVTIHWQSGK